MPKNFAGQNLRGKSFKGQDLTGADFSGADIRSANFAGANLTGANFACARAGVRWPERTAIALYLGGTAYVFAAFAGVWFFALSEFILEKTTFITSFGMFITVTLVMLILFMSILIVFIRNGEFWGGLMTTSLAVALVGAVVLTGAESGVMTVAAAIGVMIVAAAMTMAMAMAGVEHGLLTIAAAVAVIIGGAISGVEIGIGTMGWTEVVETITTATIFFALNSYIRRRTLHEDPQFVIFRRFIKINATGGTNFQQANLSNVNFADADLKHAYFMNPIVTCTNWQGAKHLNWARLDSTILADQAVRELLVRGNAHDAIANIWQPSPTAFIGKNLKGAYLVKADLNGVDFTEADLSGADLQGANLRNANLTKTVMLGQIQNMQGNVIQGAENFKIEQRFDTLTPQSTPQEFAALLTELQRKIAQLPLPEDQKEEIAHEVKTAEIQAKKPQPDKPKMAAALDNAKTVLQKIGETVPEAVAIGKLVGKAIDYISGLL